MLYINACIKFKMLNTISQQESELKSIFKGLF
jgi:hypothetical protein